jgi:hypothetical protein
VSMAQLPNVGNAILADAKIAQYLLNDAHPQNRGKAKFFMLFGFTLANWQELKKALLDHPHNNLVVGQTTFQYGEMYEVSCAIASPDSRNPCVRSFWAIEPPGADPKFITAYAAPPQGGVAATP